MYLESLDFSDCIASLDALWHDLPIVITLPGGLMRGRQTYGMLRLLELDELVAQSKDDYVRIAVRLARDDAWRDGLRAHIRERKLTLYQDRGAVDALTEFLANVEHPRVGKPDA